MATLDGEPLTTLEGLAVATDGSLTQTIPLPAAGALLRQVDVSLWRSSDGADAAAISICPAVPARGARTMRLLLTSDFFHPIIGGAERQVGLLAEALAGHGHDVRVATTAQPGLPARDVVEGIAVDRLVGIASALPAPGGGRRFLPPAPDPMLSIGIRQLVDALATRRGPRERLDRLLDRGRLLDHAAPMVLSVRDYGHACATRNLLWHDRALCDGPALGRCLDCAGRHYGAARALIAVGGVRSGRPLAAPDRACHPQCQPLRGTHPGPGPAARRSRLATHHGAHRRHRAAAPDAAHAAPFDRREWGLLGRLPVAPYILFVGALQTHKGLDVLLEAWARMRGSAAVGVPRWCSSAPDRRTRPATFPAGVTVLSDVPHRVVMAAWERCLFGVVPSIWPDPLPGVVREPMTRGKAVIGSDIGGIPDMISDDLNGLLVRAGDSTLLASAMDRLVDDPACGRVSGRPAGGPWQT